MRSPRSRSTNRRRKRASYAHHSRSVACVGSALPSHTTVVSSCSTRQPSRARPSRSDRALTSSTPWCPVEISFTIASEHVVADSLRVGRCEKQPTAGLDQRAQTLQNGERIGEMLEYGEHDQR